MRSRPDNGTMEAPLCAVRYCVNYNVSSPCSLTKSMIITNNVKIFSRDKISSWHVILRHNYYQHVTFKRLDPVNMVETMSMIIDFDRSPLCIKHHKPYSKMWKDIK